MGLSNESKDKHDTDLTLVGDAHPTAPCGILFLKTNMHPETVRLLGTLEVLYGYHNSLLWETATQGEFALWNLLISQGFVTPTDAELAFEHWQNMERWGTPTEMVEYEYAPLRSEMESKDWNEAIATQRQEIYHHLQQLLDTHLQNRQAYKLSVHQDQTVEQCFAWNHPVFSVYIVVGELNGHWLCLAPTVPDQIGVHYRGTGVHFRKPNQIDPAIWLDTSQVTKLMADSSLVNQLISLLEALQPIEMCGYYDGGYDYTYTHRIVGAIAPSLPLAIEQALKVSEMVVFVETTVEKLADFDIPELGQFMNKCLQNSTHYSVSFWDIGYTYVFGETPGNDWIGVSSMSEFEYNP